MTDTSIALNSFRAVIALWRSPGALADDIGATVASARKWDQRDSIPPEWWQAIVDSDTGKAGGVTPDLLTELASRRVVREPLEARP